MAMQEGYWVTRTYEAGQVGEKIKFFVPGKRPDRKVRRKDLQNIRKQEQNQYNAVRALARKLNANFSARDLLMGLDYSPEGMERILAWGRAHGLEVDAEDETVRMDAVWEAAAHELDIALRRVKRRLEKQGVELEAVYITSDMDGSTGEHVRVHHHLVVKAGVQDAFLDAWEKQGLGGVSWSPMRAHQKDRTPIAEYLLRQVRRIPDAKKYRSTRNLKRPVAKDRIAASAAEIRVPAGAELLFRQEYRPNQPQYIRYVLPEKKARKKPDPQADGSGSEDCAAEKQRDEKAPLPE